MIEIAIVNESTVLEDVEVHKIAKAIQIQVERDFLPIWGVNARITAVSKHHIPTDHWVLAFLDNADQADALGYHDVTPKGLPLGKAFVKPTIAEGSKISSTASHELLEMLGDPDINLVAELDNAKGDPKKFYAYELCDACEDDAFGYEIDGVLMSDFVFPAYFEGFRKPHSTQFDFGKHVSQPFQILKGGYNTVLDLGRPGNGWQQLTTDKKGSIHRPHSGSRRERRRTSREHWNASEFKVVERAAAEKA